ncbi:Tetratricopeptide repeat protein [Candidatus Koribacter versatilis Ellin345]|uniref:Tetratricopeptide repeat protein n=1 Tax=Koribacter versatilis (strain Ellin345) TaxID=204669 RepID=Q1IPA0_KORVE|nr:Tetratricopeptide repeat protein [Candidatus Koribacter versatilis Ellin345]
MKLPRWFGFALLCCGRIAAMGQQNGEEVSNLGNLSVNLQIRVLMADDRAVSQSLHVRLMSEGATVSTTQTDSSGSAAMTITRAGTYQIEVSGPGIETTDSEQFPIVRADRNHNEVIRVALKGQKVEGKPTAGGVAPASGFTVPKDASKEFDAGVSSMHASDWKKAQEHFQSAIDKYPNFDAAWDNLGMARQNGGDAAGAKAAYQKALGLNDHNADAQRNLARVFEAEGNWPGAEELLVKSLGIEPNNAGSLTLLSIAQLKQNKIDEAIASAGRVHALEHKSYATAHLVLAQAYEMKGRTKDAISEYQLFLSEEPNGPRSEAAKKKMAKLQAAG